MRRVLATVLLAFLAILPTSASVTDIMQSVAYLQTGEAPAHCTAWSVGLGRWITEAHCVDADPLVINGQPVKVVKVDIGGDLALLDGPVVTPLEVSKKEPVFEGKDGRLVEATLYGWPGSYPSPRPFVYSGRLAALDVEQVGEKDQYDHHNINIFAAGAGGGMSGGPIVQDGKVVGMVEAGLALGWPNGGLASIGHATASQTVKDIRKFVGLK